MLRLSSKSADLTIIVWVLALDAVLGLYSVGRIDSGGYPADHLMTCHECGSWSCTLYRGLSSARHGNGFASPAASRPYPSAQAALAPPCSDVTTVAACRRGCARRWSLDPRILCDTSAALWQAWYWTATSAQSGMNWSFTTGRCLGHLAFTSGGSSVLLLENGCRTKRQPCRSCASTDPDLVVSPTAATHQRYRDVQRYAPVRVLLRYRSTWSAAHKQK